MVKLPIEDDEARLLLRHGAIFRESGTIEMPDGQWGCLWCAGTGYESYPDRSTPCRVEGHRERADKELESLLHGWGSGSSLRRE
jgi:hypothetical protein